jgi:hypothetical protein
MNAIIPPSRLSFFLQWKYAAAGMFSFYGQCGIWFQFPVKRCIVANAGGRPHAEFSEDDDENKTVTGYGPATVCYHTVLSFQ